MIENRRHRFHVQRLVSHDRIDAINELRRESFPDRAERYAFKLHAEIGARPRQQRMEANVRNYFPQHLTCAEIAGEEDQRLLKVNHRVVTQPQGSLVQYPQQQLGH